MRGAVDMRFGFDQLAQIDATANRLRFDFWYRAYGPIHYDLERVTLR